MMIVVFFYLLTTVSLIAAGDRQYSLQFRPAAGQEITGLAEVVTRTSMNGIEMKPTYMSTCTNHIVLPGPTPVKVIQRKSTVMKPMSCCGAYTGACDRDSLSALLKPARQDTFEVEISREASLSSKIKKPTPFGQHPSMAFVAPAEPVALGESWTFSHASSLSDSATSMISIDSTRIRYTLERIVDSEGVSFAIVSAQITHHLSATQGSTIVNYDGAGSAEYKVDLATGILHHAQGSIKMKGALIGERASKQFTMNTDLDESYRFCLLGL